ncbi:MAG: trypsin-like peptidase domain-containing protein, partial [Planctomycetaceae bacterium]|nr:trypsin-like peptidase domain-containing protein [Planctomycetaceae bacterium]
PPGEEKMADVLPADGSPVVLYFRADWCGPCQLMEKSIKGLPESGTPLVTIDIDERSELARRFQIDRIPTVIRVVEGAETDRKSGIMSADELRTLLSPDQRTVATPTAAIIRVTSENGSLDIGSGFFVRDDLNRIRIITAAHLFRGADPPKARVSFPGVHSLFSARVMIQDADADVAVLEPVSGIDLENLVTPVELRTGELKVDDKVSVCGFPLEATHDEFGLVVEYGTVRSINKYQGPANFEIGGVEAAQGMSGAMVLDEAKRLCGIVIAVDRQERVTVCSDLSALRLVNQTPLFKTPGWNNLEPLPSDAAELKKTNYRGGLLIGEVMPDGPAYKAGIREGDILVGLDVYETLNHYNVAYALTKYDFESQEGPKFYVVRNGETLFGRLELTSHPPFDEWIRRLNSTEQVPPRQLVPARITNARGVPQDVMSPASLPFQLTR